VTIITSGGNGAAAAGIGDEDGVIRVGRNLAVPFNGAENNVTIGWGLRRRLDALIGDGARDRFDVVHVHCPLSPVLPLVALKVATAPLVGTFHTASDSDWLLRAFRRPLGRYLARLDRSVAVSEAAREYVLRLFPADIAIVPNGVDLARFRPGVPALPRFDDGMPNILFVGRFDPRKGIPDLLRACERLAREGHRFRLILVGDGMLRGEAERLARGALRGRVHFEGRVDHDRLPAYYATADLFCSPARGGESFGMVLLEAMALGVPVVCTDLPGHRSLVTHGSEGLLVPRRDPDALVSALARLLVDRGERLRLGANGLARASGFGWDGIAARLEAIYDSVAPRRAGSNAATHRAASALASAGA
jgi:phosphatidylinositol alpha-mannosyltransferase